MALTVELLKNMDAADTTQVKTLLSGIKATVRKGSGSGRHILTVTTDKANNACVIKLLSDAGFSLEWERDYTNKIDFVKVLPVCS